MRFRSLAWLLGTILLVGRQAGPVHAQGYSFSVDTPSGARPEGPAATVATTSIALYPLASFQASAPSSLHDTGALIAAEKTFGQFGVGGWYWFNYARGSQSQDFYELHGDYNLGKQFGNHLGIQAGVLSSPSHVEGESFDVFVTGQISSAQLNQKTRYPWAIQVGAGPFIDATFNQSSTNATAFVAGSLEMAKHLTLQASYWYVRDQSLNVNRLAIGVGYSL